MRIQATFLSVFVFAAQWAVAQATTLQFAARADTSLYEDPSGGLSNGAGQYLFAGRSSTGAIRRALVAFDVGAIPAGARILDVQLRLHVAQSTSGAPLTATLHRVDTAWGEAASAATGNEVAGAPALPGDATWTHAVLPASPWTTPGGDFAAAASSTALLPPSGVCAFERTVPMLADVQDWVTGYRGNHGWIVVADELVNGTARGFDSRDNSAAGSLPPLLTVTFLTPGTFVSLGTGCDTSGGVPLQQTLTGQVGQGQTFTLGTHSNVPYGLFVTWASYDVLPEPTEAQPGCFFWLRSMPFPNLGICVQDGAGNWSRTFTLPYSPLLFGLPVALQSVMVDWAHPRQYALSNAHLVCVN